MFDSSILSTLKRNNISKNAELTSNRVGAYYKKSTRQQKNDMDEISGLKRVSMYRIVKTGAITAKAAIAVAAVLNIDPFYLTAETDEIGEFSDEKLYAFLADKGYANTVKTLKRRKTVAAKTAEAVEIEPQAEPEPAVAVPTDNYLQPFLTEDEAVLLLRGLYVRANHSCEANYRLSQINELLV